jgi:uncharacterized protein (DUF1697 family)
MTVFVALLRAVNVGGTGKLPMRDLAAMCEKLGFGKVRTYIASGNVVFACGRSEAAVKTSLEAAMQDYAGKPVGVFVRTGPEMATIVAGNPFPDAPPARVAAIFLDAPPAGDALDRIRGRAFAATERLRPRRRDGEEIALGRREIYVHYVNGMGRSQLTIPAAADGTARNMNTVAKLAAMASDL